jgi:phosphate:Na+ symporter
MLGSNIGTCATAQVAAIRGNIGAKRTAWAHTLYNIAGALAALIVIKPFVALITAASPGMPVERQIANSHTMFNILSAVIFLPITKQYVSLIEKIVPDRKNRR